MAFKDALSSAEQARYARHLTLPEIGASGQARLKAARVLVVGAGGLGSPACLYLAAAGIGTLSIVDFDQVDSSNLQRQIIFDTADVEQNKAERAAARLRALNPDIKIHAVAERLDATNVEALITQHDVVIDGTDNQTTRYLLNDACFWARTPLVYGSVYRFEGQVSVFNISQGPCYRCVFPNQPGELLAADCSVAGVLGVLPAVIGSLQATEAIKIITHIGSPLSGRLLLYDALQMRFDEVSYQKNPHCSLCGKEPTIRSLNDSLASIQTSEKKPGQFSEISAMELRDRLAMGEKLQILDVRSAQERALNQIEPSTHIPLGELAARVKELDPDAEVIVHCQAGGRSAKACALLTEIGFVRITNLAGGMNAWCLLDPED